MKGGKKKEMKKSNLFLIMFIATIMILSFVAAQVTIKEIADPVKDMFASWSDGDLSLNVAKYAFWILIGLVIYSILGFIDIFNKHQYIQILSAVIISFLATAYLTTSNIHAMLTSYGALGYTLGALIPFVIVAFFSVSINKKGGVRARLLSRAIWAAFIVFLIYKLISGMWVDGVIDTPEGLTYLGLIAFGLFWIWKGEKMFLKILFKEEYNAIGADKLRDVASSLTTEISRREERSAELSGGAKSAYDRKTESLREELKRIQGQMCK